MVIQYLEHPMPSAGLEHADLVPTVTEYMGVSERPSITNPPYFFNHIQTGGVRQFLAWENRTPGRQGPQCLIR